MIIHSKRIYTEEGVIDGYFTIEDGVIKKIIAHECPEGAYDLGDLRVIPGIFDTHNHGIQGYPLLASLAEIDDASLKGYLKGAAAEGITSIFPTPIIMPGDLTTVKTIADFKEETPTGATIEGIHLEGPYLNRVGENGVRHEPYVIDLAYVQKLIKASRGKLKLMGHAPELANSEKLVSLLLDNGVTVAFTHSDCKAQEAFASFARGVSVATHLCNVMVGIHHRDVGGLGAALLDKRVYCELICDGIHVSNDMLRLIWQIKAHDHLMMISDCVGLDGAPQGVYQIPGMGTITVDEKGMIRDETGRISGSSKPVLYGVKNLVEKVGLDLADVVPLFSLNPCRKYGIADCKGSLKAGKEADFVIIDDDYQVLATYVKGIKVYDQKEKEKIFNRQLLKLLA